MPKSRGRTPKPKRQKLPASPQTQTQQPQEPRKGIVRKFVDHPIALLIGLIAAVIALGEFVHQALVSPEISVDSNVDVSAPFAVPFAVKNKGWLFSMNDAQLRCIIKRVALKQWALEGLTLVSGRTTTIPASGEGAFRCLVGPQADNVVRIEQANLVSGHIFLSMSYKTIGIARTSAPVEFTWYTGANPPRWIRGKVAD